MLACKYVHSCPLARALALWMTRAIRAKYRWARKIIRFWKSHLRRINYQWRMFRENILIAHYSLRRHRRNSPAKILKSASRITRLKLNQYFGSAPARIMWIRPYKMARRRKTSEIRVSVAFATSSSGRRDACGRGCVSKKINKPWNIAHSRRSGRARVALLSITETVTAPRGIKSATYLAETLALDTSKGNDDVRLRPLGAV